MAAFRDEMTSVFGSGKRPSGARHKSSRVGPARDADGQPTMAYRALEGLTCGQCGKEILAGELFVRRAVSLIARHGRGLTQAPVCATCRPLTRMSDGGGDE